MTSIKASAADHEEEKKVYSIPNSHQDGEHSSHCSKQSYVQVELWSGSRIRGYYYYHTTTSMSQSEKDIR